MSSDLFDEVGLFALLRAGYYPSRSIRVLYRLKFTKHKGRHLSVSSSFLIRQSNYLYIISDLKDNFQLFGSCGQERRRYLKTYFHLSNFFKAFKYIYI